MTPLTGDEVSGVVLAGGLSTRMGRDKALLDFGGRPLITVGRDALRAAGAAEVLAVGGQREALERLGFAWVADPWPGEGPLGAVVAGLTCARADVVVVLACDLPNVERATVEALLEPMADENVDAAVPVVAGLPQPLLAAYRRRCRAVLEAARAAGERSLRRPLAHLAVRTVALAEPRWAHNANRVTDLPAHVWGAP